ncbi:MAG TPA: hypothetical protein VJO12_11275 [Stellaceae bacterium]|nr:hypothetical protein [Stellaceae bacterium]
MADPSNTISDRNLEASTTLSLKREPACFAFLCSRAVSAPLPVDAINLDLASVDYFSGRASLWATLEVRSGATNEQPTAVLGFDETFLRPFTRALIEAAASRNPYRMTIMLEPGETARQRVVEYVTGPGTALREVILTPHDTVIVISGRADDNADEETLFQLPRSDSFLRAFVKMTCQADQALRETLVESERLARQRTIQAS